MKSLSFLMTLFAVVFEVSAQVLPTRTIHVVDGSAITTATSTELLARVKSNPSATLSELYDVFANLDELSGPAQVQQLRLLVKIRQSLESQDIHSLALSSLLGVLVVHGALPLVATYEATYQSYSGTWIRPRISQQAQVASLVSLLGDNALLFVRSRSRVMYFCGLVGDPETSFMLVLDNAVQQAREQYENKWGSNVLAMQKAKGIDGRPRGLAPLLNRAAFEWENVVAGPREVESLAWWVGADLLAARAAEMSKELASHLSESGGGFVSNSDAPHSAGAVESLWVLSRKAGDGGITGKLMLR